MPSLRSRACAAALLLGLAAAAHAEATRSVFLEDLTWTELRDQIRAGKSAFLICNS